VAEPFSVAFAHPHPFGFLVGVVMPRSREAVSEAVLARLHREEAQAARALGGFRQVEWVAGRLAGQEAGRHLAAPDWRLLAGPGRAPRPPRGFVASIAHKRDLAVALVAPGDSATVGVDLEDDIAAARSVAGLILLPEERTQVARLESEERDRAVLVAFAVKEAVYKALAVRVGRLLGYHEARVDGLDSSTPSVTMRLDGAERQPTVEVSCAWRGGQLIAAVRAPAGSP